MGRNYADRVRELWKKVPPQYFLWLSAWEENETEIFFLESLWFPDPADEKELQMRYRLRMKLTPRKIAFEMMYESLNSDEFLQIIDNYYEGLFDFDDGEVVFHVN